MKHRRQARREYDRELGVHFPRNFLEYPKRRCLGCSRLGEYGGVEGCLEVGSYCMFDVSKMKVL